MAYQLASEQYPALCIALFHHRNTLDQPMTFERREWLIPIYKDNARCKVFMKSVQCGISEYGFCWTMAQLHAGRSVFFVLPTKVIRDKIVANRIDPLIQSVDFYRKESTVDNTGLKRLWGSAVSFVGSNVLADFGNFTAQAKIVDELDRCDSKNLELADDRLSATELLTGKKPETVLISNPTLPNYGIHAAYKLSDQKQWHIKCEHCGEWQPLDWFVNFVKQTSDNDYSLLQEAIVPPCSSVETGRDLSPLCRKCFKPMDRLARGEWVAENSGSEISGYHISKLFTGQCDMTELWTKFVAAQSNSGLMQGFYNSELGIPYDAPGDRMSFSDFEKCSSDYLMPLRAGSSIGGVDVGKVFHVHLEQLVNGKRQKLFIGIARTPKELIDILTRYNCRLYVMDSRPEMHLAKEILKQRPGGLLCDYLTSESMGEPSINRDDRSIKVNRTESMDESLAAYMQGRVLLPKNWRDLDNGDFVSQMMAPTRKMVMVRNRPTFVWDEAGQPDHHRHADNYCHIAAKLSGFGEVRREIIWI